MRLTPVLGGMTPERRETRPESLFPSRDGGSRVRVTARVSHAPIMIILFFLISLRESHLLFTSMFHLQSSHIPLVCSI